MNRRPSSIERLRANKNQHDLFVFSINSLNDDDFLAAVNDHVRDVIVTASIREENIHTSRQTGKMSTTAKEVSRVMKLEQRNDVVDFLHSLDDYTLRKLVTDETLRYIIEEDHALSQRYSNITETSPVTGKASLSPRYASDQPPPVFSLEH